VIRRVGPSIGSWTTLALGPWNAAAPVSTTNPIVSPVGAPGTSGRIAGNAATTLASRTAAVEGSEEGFDVESWCYFLLYDMLATVS
jgi:hypothetical protein